MSTALPTSTSTTTPMTWCATPCVSLTLRVRPSTPSRLSVRSKVKAASYAHLLGDDDFCRFYWAQSSSSGDRRWRQPAVPIRSNLNASARTFATLLTKFKEQYNLRR
jgi:hypothetical protein